MIGLADSNSLAHEGTRAGVYETAIPLTYFVLVTYELNKDKVRALALNGGLPQSILGSSVRRYELRSLPARAGLQSVPVAERGRASENLNIPQPFVVKPPLG